MATRKAIEKEAPKGASKRLALAKVGDAPSGRRRVVVGDADELSGHQAPSYFASGVGKQHIEFISSGCSLMDEALSGGYPLGRVSNIVGDKSSGKTLAAMELCANFASQYPDGWIRYAEAEAAFDEPYARAMGIPLDRITLNKDVQRPKKKATAKQKADAEASGLDAPEPEGGDAPMKTVEDLYDDMLLMLDANKGRPGLYIIDSLDALSDDAEMEADFDAGTFGGKKPKQIGKLFRMLVDRLEEQRVHFMVVSQLRDKIGVTFGETKTRSGGRALDFYATHIIWLAELGKMKRTISSIDRIVGVDVQAYVKKNKVGLPFRKAAYSILYGYGIDDLMACAEWLYEVKRDEEMKEIGFSKNGYKVRINNIRNKGGADAREMRQQLRKLVRKAWAEIETTFLPQSRKY